MSFSRRMWFEKEPLLQREGITEKLAIRIRNAIYEILDLYGKKIEKDEYWTNSYSQTDYTSMILIRMFADTYWITIDSLPEYFNKTMEYIKDWFFKQERHKQYDFIEFIYTYLQSEVNIQQIWYFPKNEWCNKYLHSINRILKSENSAYILLKSWDIVPITEESEIECIQESLEVPYENVKKHIKDAIKLFKEEPKNYRNSIKESISAVEVMCRELTGMPKATLWDALKHLKESWVEIHPALEKGYSCIYWYTNDEWWIRHGFKMNSIEVTFDDAKYMLVSCSAFINYLIWKSQQIKQ